MARTKVDAEMATDQERFSDDPERAEVLRRARQFKASWIDLAESLTNIRRGGQWKGWGYDSFEAYAKTELRLRQETIEKLTASYAFLKKRAPAVLERDALLERVPSYQAVDYLRRAEEHERAPRDLVDTMYAKVIDKGASLPQIKKEFNATVFPLTDGQKKEHDAAGIRNVATRLVALLGETKVIPHSLAKRAKDVLHEVLDEVSEKVAAE